MSAERVPVPAHSAPSSVTRPNLVEPAQLRRELARVVAVLTREWEPTARSFILDLVEAAHESTVTPVIARFGEKPSSMLSRFQRAGLPTPKDLHTALRLWLYLALRERGVRGPMAAYAIGANSPQGFNRICKRVTTLTASVFPLRFTATDWWDRTAAYICFEDIRWTRFRAKAAPRGQATPLVLK